MIATAKEAIKMLESMYGNAPDETLVITWWDSEDFKGMNPDEAFNIANDALNDVCIGHVNEQVADNVTWLDDELLEEGEN